MMEENQMEKLVSVIVDTLKLESITLRDTLHLIELGKEKALESGISMVIAVVDSGGNLIAQQRMDNAFIGSIAISLSKAYTAAALQISTEELAGSVLPGQPLYGLPETGGGHFCVFGGGIPIMRKGRCIGGLGVSGGTLEQDLCVAKHIMAHWK
ncbi:MAG: heme-binding protein [Hungatella sp.]|nr:heme-binding protein [Hungatella sp.]